MAIAGLIALGGCVAGGKLGTAFGLTAFLFGAMCAFPFFVLGVLVSAQGQILKATLDMAVQASPFLSQDEMRAVMSLEMNPPPLA